MSHDTDRHGLKLGCQEAEAFSILESEALTCFKLDVEAEARLFVENQKDWRQSQSF